MQEDELLERNSSKYVLFLIAKATIPIRYSVHYWLTFTVMYIPGS